MADLTTFIPVRQQARGRGADLLHGARRRTRSRWRSTPRTSATILLRYEGGARGSVNISQLSPGRKNSIAYQIDGSSSAVAWDSEQPEQLWIGHRDRPNELLLRNPALMNARRRRGGPAARRSRGGLRRHVRRRVHAPSTTTSSRARPSARPRYATFAAGHEEMLIGDAVLESCPDRRLGQGRPRTVDPSPVTPQRSSRDEARLPDRPVPGDAADGGGRLGRRRRLRGPRDRLLAAGRRPHPPLRGHQPHRRREPVARRRRPRSAARSRRRASRSPASASTPTRSTRTRSTGRRSSATSSWSSRRPRRWTSPLVNTFMGGDGAKNQDQNWEEALRVWPDIVSVRAGPRAQDHARELPDAVQRRRVAGRAQHRHHARACGAGSWSSGAARSGSTSTPATSSCR